MLEKADPILLRVMLSDDDFERAGDFVKAARAYPVGGIEYEALLHSAILGEDLPLHDRLITLRNKVIAHAESEFFPAQTLKPAIGTGAKGQRGIAFQRRSWHVVDEKLDLDVFERMATNMRYAARQHVCNVAQERGLLQEGPFGTE